MFCDSLNCSDPHTFSHNGKLLFVAPSGSFIAPSNESLQNWEDKYMQSQERSLEPQAAPLPAL